MVPANGNCACMTIDMISLPVYVVPKPVVSLSRRTGSSIEASERSVCVPDFLRGAAYAYFWAASSE